MKFFCGSLLVILSSAVFGQSSDLQKIQSLNERSYYNLTRDRDSVCVYAQRAYRLNNHRFPAEEAKNFLMLGMCQKYNGRMDSAYSLFDQAIDFFEENEMLDDLGLAYWYLGKVWHDLQQFEKAAPFYLKAIETYENVGNHESQFKVINGLAVMELMQGNYINGLEYLKQALAIVEREQLYDNHFRLYNNLGAVYKHLNEDEKAMEFFEMAISITDTSTRKGLMVQALTNKADLFQKIGAPDSAIFYYDQALNVAEKFNINAILIQVKKSDFQYSRNQTEEAIASLRKAVTDSVSPAIILDRYLLLLGDRYNEINRLDSALFFAESALNRSLQNNIKATTYKSAKLLSDIYLKQNNYPKAFEYLGAYSAYKDSVFNSDTERKISDLRVQVETLDKTNEIELLKTKAQIDELSRISLYRQGISTLLILILVIVVLILWYRYRQKKQKIELLKLQSEMEMSELELQKQTLHMISVNNKMREVEDSLRLMNKKSVITYKDIRKVISGIMVKKTMDKEWDKFENFFSNTHRTFNDNLLSKHQNLTQQDRRLTTLIKMDLSNREIASILDIEQRSVIIKRYRLKKKMNLEKDGDLEKYIQSL